MPCFRTDRQEAPTGAPVITDRDFSLPGDAPHYAPDRPVDIRHVDLRLTVDFAAKTLRGVCATTVNALFDVVPTVTLQAAEMRVSGVTVAQDGPARPATFDYDGERLVVDLPAALRFGQTAVVTVDYATMPRIGLSFVGPLPGDPTMATQAHTQGQPEYAHYWFPCHDSPNDRATWHLEARVPAHTFAVSNGQLSRVVEHPESGEHTFVYDEAFPFPAYIATLAVGEFSEIMDRFGETPVPYYVRPGQEAHARRMMGDTPNMLAYYSERFGIRYPYEKYAQVILEQFTGAMENTSATSHTWLLLPDERAFADWEGKATVAHELVHQWFGDLLTCRDWSHAWLNESFATYFEETYKQADPTAGELEFRLGMRNNQRFYQGEDKTYRRPIVYNVFASDGQELFDRHLYEKGSCVLHMLRFVVGEGAFWRAIQRYAAVNRGREVITADLERAFEEATGKSLGRFFEQWVYRGGHPEFEVKYAWDGANHLASVTVRQTQKVDELTPLFATPIHLAFTLEDGERRETKTFTVQVERDQETFVFPLARRPALVRFDPYGWILKTVKFERPVSMLRWQLANDEDPLGRLEAAVALAKHDDPTSVAALVSALNDEATFWAVRAETARSLGNLKTDAALDALLAAVATERHPKARRAIVAALGEFHAPERAAAAERVAAAMSELLQRGDASYLVEAEAATTLGRTRTAGAAATLLAARERPSWHELVFGGVAAGLGELGTAEAATTLADWLMDERQPFLRRQYAAMGLQRLIATGRLTPDSAAHTRVREALTVALSDPWVRARSFAAAALKALDDPAAIPALEARAELELESRPRRQMRDAALTLRRGKRGAADAQRLRRDLEEMREENRKLRARVTVIETRTGATNGAASDEGDSGNE